VSVVIPLTVSNKMWMYLQTIHLSKKQHTPLFVLFPSDLHISRYTTALIGSIAAIMITVILANLVRGEEDHSVATLYGYIIQLAVGGLLIGVAFWTVRRFGIDSVHGVAWLSFVGFALMWVIADMIWNAEEILLPVDTYYPSSADLVYLMGYPFLLMFLVSYLIPFKDAISKRLITLAILFSVISVIASMYLQFVINADSLEQITPNTPTSLYDAIVVVLYPVADGIILVPTILGIGIFLRDSNRVKPMWVLIFLGTLSNFAADVVFMVIEPREEYFTGHPVDILFLVAYVLIAFGVYGYGKNNKNYFRKKP